MLPYYTGMANSLDTSRWWFNCVCVCVRACVRACVGGCGVVWCVCVCGGFVNAAN